ncbi:hypothetical protein DRN98_08990, partial [Methanosarcinales archaeon]
FVTVYGNANTIEKVKFLLGKKKASNFNFKVLSYRKKYSILGLTVKPIKVFHDRRFPTFAYNFSNVFFYCADMGPIFDEYELQYLKNNILMVIDGAYWDHQIPLNNHIAVLEWLDFILSLNNKYVLFTGMGNQWPPLSEANAKLSQLLTEYKQKHPECVTVEVRAAREGERLRIPQQVLKGEIVKVSFDKILKEKEVLQKISKKELLMLHLRCHQLWANKKTSKILQVHVLIVKELLKRGFKHRIINDLDRKTYKILGITEAKIFKLFSELEPEIIVSSGVVKIVGSALYKTDPQDVDVIAPMPLAKILKSRIPQPHFLGSTASHGDVAEVYDLVLKKRKSLRISNINKLDYNKPFKLAPIRKTLPVSDLYIVEPYIQGFPRIIVDKDKQLAIEVVETDTGDQVVTDFLAFKQNNFLNEVFVNRLTFMFKKWLDANQLDIILPHRWFVKRHNLPHLLAILREKGIQRVVIRPANAKYYDGKFILDLTKSSSKQLKPGVVFTPLKASGSSYHELEYFNVNDAWNYFCSFYVKTEGKVRAEPKWDGLRCIAQFDGSKALIYFEDAKENRAEYLPTLVQDLKKLGPVILDGELMEVSNDKYVSRHELLKWAHGKPRLDDSNIRLKVFDCLYTESKGDLHNLPLKERVKTLKALLQGKGLKCIELPPYWDITSKSQLSSAFRPQKNKYSGTDGLMLKAYSGNYPLTGKTQTWVKLKVAYEFDAIILKVHQAGKAWNYTVGYAIP